MNEHGVACALNAIRTPSLDTKLLPLHLFLRTVLEQPSLAACLTLTAALPGLASAGHILIADATGAVGIEAAPQGFVLLHEDEHGMVHHTNHLVDAALSGRSHELVLAPDSQPRLALLKTLTAHVSAFAPSTAAIRGVLSDRSMGPQGVCRHQSGDGNGKGVRYSCCLRPC